jgi:hypothetical protein
MVDTQYLWIFPGERSWTPIFFEFILALSLGQQLEEVSREVIHGFSKQSLCEGRARRRVSLLQQMCASRIPLGIRRTHTPRFLSPKSMASNNYPFWIGIPPCGRAAFQLHTLADQLGNRWLKGIAMAPPAFA